MSVRPKHREAGKRWPRIAVWPAALAVVLAAATVGQAQQRAYVANLGSNSVSVIDSETAGVVATVPVGDNPDGVVASPDGRLVYVANFLSDDVSVIDTTAAAVIATISVGSGPVGVGITPDGTTVLVANRGSNTVSVIDTATNTVTATIGAGLGPNAVAVTPDGRFAYVTNSFTSAPGTVSVIDIGARTLAAPIEVGSSPNRLAISPDGAFIYVTNFRSWNVSVIDAAAHAVTTIIPVFGRPTGVAINPNGADLYVVTLGGRVEIIGTDTDTLDAEFAAGDSPYGIATTRNGGLAYVANFGDGTVAVVDLATVSVTTSVTVGTRPFAVALGCSGPICTQPPFTPRPTRTPTTTPTVTSTGTVTHIPTATRTPLPTQTRQPTATFAVPPVQIRVGSATGASGTQVSVAVTLHTAGFAVAGTQNDIGFDAQTPIAVRANGHPDCTVNPDIGKTGTAFAFRPNGCTGGVDCTALRALVLGIDNTEPIADGAVLYTCRVAIAAQASAGTYPLLITPFDTLASDPEGNLLPVAGVDGSITAVATGQSGAFTSQRGAVQGSGAGCAIDRAGEVGCQWEVLVTAGLLAWRRRRLHRA